MSHLRFALVVATLSVATSIAASGQERTPSRPPCVFPESEDITTPVVVGPDSIVNRLEFFQPKNAPIRILRADFTGSKLTMGGPFRFTHNYSLEVVNVTEQIALIVSPFVWVFSGDVEGAHHGGGHGPINRIPLGPGQRRVLRTEGSASRLSGDLANDSLTLSGWLRAAAAL
ncbi:MAG TPA: hypothetical protein VKB50_07475 [Vicinamibacterales bacterium]|nr:hypothetical protein [Vicinamibacterales bacterium]